MNTLLKSFAVGVAFAIAPLALAVEEEDLSGDTYTLPEVQAKAIQSLPTPVRTPAIKGVRMDMVGTTVELSFRVDENGRTRHVKPVVPLWATFDARERDLAVQLKQAVQRWKFEPARDARHQPISVRVILPVTIVEKQGKAFASVSLRLDPAEQDPS